MVLRDVERWYERCGGEQVNLAAGLRVVSSRRFAPDGWGDGHRAGFGQQQDAGWQS
jgi:hypothetical protein